MATKSFTLAQYLNFAGYTSRDKFIATKMLAHTGPHTIVEWTRLLMQNRIIEEPTSSVLKLLSKEEISSLKK